MTTSERVSGSSAPPFRAYVDRTRGVPEDVATCTFKLRLHEGVEVFSAAGTVPATGSVEFQPTIGQMTLDPGAYQWRFDCVRDDGETWSTPWLPIEITD